MRIPEGFYQDESGQWWYTYKGGTRGRTSAKACALCGSEFLLYPAHKNIYCSRKCSAVAYGNKNKRGVDSHLWQGGTYTQRGYVYAYAPDHPACHKPGNVRRTHVRRNRLVMEQMLGRYLLPNENVHHLNGDTQDDRPENLELWQVMQPYGQRVKDVPHCPTCRCGL